MMRKKARLSRSGNTNLQQHTKRNTHNMITYIATAFCLALAFSSMLLSWYILMPQKKK